MKSKRLDCRRIGQSKAKAPGQKGYGAMYAMYEFTRHVARCAVCFVLTGDG